MDAEKPKVPFDSFDFFGYIIPGIMLLMGFYAHDRLLYNEDGPCLQLWKALFPSSDTILNIYIFPVILFLGVIVAYILGHVVSAFSSPLLDRFVMGRISDYPYFDLLRLHETDRKKYRRYSSKIFLIGFFAVSIYISFWRPNLIVLCITGVMTIVILFLKQKTNTLWDKEETEKGKEIEYSEIIKGRLRLFSAYYKIVRCFHQLGKGLFRPIKTSLNIGHSFSGPFRKLFSDKFMDIYKNDLEGFDTNVFWLTGMYIIRNMPINAALAQKAYRLCTLMRNLTMSALLLFCYGVIVHYGYEALLRFLNVPIIHGPTIEKKYYIWISIMAIIAGILWTRFYNIYYNHFTKLVLRAFITPKENAIPSPTLSTDSQQSKLQEHGILSTPECGRSTLKN